MLCVQCFVWHFVVSILAGNGQSGSQSGSHDRKNLIGCYWKYYENPNFYQISWITIIVIFFRRTCWFVLLNSQLVFHILPYIFSPTLLERFFLLGSTFLLLHGEIFRYCQTHLLLLIQYCYIIFIFYNSFSHCYFHVTWRNLLNIYSKLNLWESPLVSNFKLYCSIITLRSNHLYLIGLLIKCFKQLGTCFS